MADWLSTLPWYAIVAMLVAASWLILALLWVLACRSPTDPEWANQRENAEWE